MVQIDGRETVRIDCSPQGTVRVEVDGNTTTYSTSCGDVVLIQVTADSDADPNLIDLSQVSAADFSAVAVVDGGGGDDTLFGSTANTLNKAFTDFLEARKTLKPRTVDGYKKMMAAAFADWRPKLLLEISQEMVSNRHQELCEEHGKAYANRAMRFLRTLYNFAQKRYQDTSSTSALPENPVKSLTAIRA